MASQVQKLNLGRKKKTAVQFDERFFIHKPFDL